MRRLISIFIFIPLLCAASCSSLFEEDSVIGKKSRLYLNFNSSDFSSAQSMAQNMELNLQLDTSAFYLSIYRVDDDPELVFQGKYSLKPESFELDPGTYSVEVSSAMFDKPEFSRPVYADKQIVELEEQENFVLSFFCRQINAGVRVKAGKDILRRYPYGLFLLSDAQYSMKYGFDEDRFLFFNPGKVNFRLVKTMVSYVDLVERYMYPGEMLTLLVGKKSTSLEDDFGIRIDTSRFWRNEYVEVVEPEEKPVGCNVDQAFNRIGDQKVWVYGYIVGGDVGTKSLNSKPPFKKDTHLAIATSPGEKNRQRVLAVELPLGEIRDALNLVDHPEFLGKKVYVKGDIVEKYYGGPGIKSVSEYSL